MPGDEKHNTRTQRTSVEKSFGLLVLLGFDVTTFTPAAYQPRSLRGPSMEVSS